MEYTTPISIYPCDSSQQAQTGPIYHIKTPTFASYNRLIDTFYQFTPTPTFSFSMLSQAASILQAEVNRLRLELQTFKVEDGSQQISIGNYLLARLAQLKVTVSFRT